LRQAQGIGHRAQALQAEAFFGIRSFSEGFSEGLAQGKGVGSRGRRARCRAGSREGKFQIF